MMPNAQCILSVVLYAIPLDHQNDKFFWRIAITTSGNRMGKLSQTAKRVRNAESFGMMGRLIVLTLLVTDRLTFWFF